jgi:hypothetical protein
MDQAPLDQRKGIPDIVFLIDVSGSMADCIKAVTTNISTFIGTLTNADANGGVLIKDWRARVIGYRDKDCDGGQWLVENNFTSDVAELKSQLENLKAAGGGDEPESLLDAMYTLSQWASAEKGAAPAANGWRYRSDAARIVAIFTDATCKEQFSLSDGSTGTYSDMHNLYAAQRLKVVLFAPEAPCYTELSQMSGLEWEQVGSIGNDPQKALVDFTTDTNNFREVMAALAKTIVQSTFTPTL